MWRNSVNLFSKILSGNEILISIKDYKVAKMTDNNANLDAVNINTYKRVFVLKIFGLKRISDINQGP